MLYFGDDDKIISDDSVNFSDSYWQIYNKTLGLSFEEWTNLNCPFKIFSANHTIINR